VFARIINLFVFLRRLVSRAEISAWLLWPRRKRGSHTRGRGMVLLQINGLSRPEMETAMRHGQLPFLKRLLDKQHYELHSMYSGLPSSTPAVQAELLYGVPGAIPSFGFRDHETNELTSLFHFPTARKVEQRLEREGQALLHHGSSYANIYTGGARRAALCFSDMGTRLLTAGAHPVSLAVVLLLHSVMLLRLAALVCIEVVLALVDIVRGLIRPGELVAELNFVPARVAVCILMREIAAAAVSADIAAGQPIILANFPGYDEQSHRRGPSSGFAHWTLRGIDDCIRRICDIAHRSSTRDYDVWVYSDHGQEATRPYRGSGGASLHDVVAQALGSAAGMQKESLDESVAGRRSRLLGGRVFGRYPNAVHRLIRDNEPFVLTGLGPVCQLYLRTPAVRRRSRREIALQLVTQADIPAVLWVTRERRVMACTAQGVFSIPEQAAALTGKDHPFAAHIGGDLERLVLHPDAGDLVMLGWVRGRKPCSFALEHGAHCGIGPHETHAFVITPGDTPWEERGATFRPATLRQAVMRFFEANRPIDAGPASPAGASAGATVVRVMTYNIHGGRGLDDRTDLRRCARAIARHCPDIVALQEVDVGLSRSGGVDQAQAIAQLLDMECHFHPCHMREEGLYGIAILTPHPLEVVRCGALPGRGGEEPRGALWVRVTVRGVILDVLTTHLSLTASVRVQQARALMSDEWLGGSLRRAETSVVVCGDLNTRPTGAAYRVFAHALRDTSALEKARAAPTWMRMLRLDYIFADRHTGVVDAFVVDSPTARKASDHAPVVADLIPAAHLARGGTPIAAPDSETI
jgi:endonuclease/exonuclease/phosphatase family metal-dependent hydrolase